MPAKLESCWGTIKRSFKELKSRYAQVTLLKFSRHHHQLMTVSFLSKKQLTMFVGKGWHMHTQLGPRLCSILALALALVSYNWLTCDLS